MFELKKSIPFKSDTPLKDAFTGELALKSVHEAVDTKADIDVDRVAFCEEDTLTVMDFV
jgi:hypothetical protein